MAEGRGERQALVVIGNGMTGFRLCRRLAECGATPGPLDLVVFGDEPRPAYDRVRLTELLAGGTEEDLRLAPASWYRDVGIDLRLGDRVVSIDRQACVVRAASGAVVPFDRLVLATGSRPFVPPIPGAEGEGVFVYRTVDDLRAILGHAAGASRAAVIGGGLLGLEAARAVQALGLLVHVVEASRGLLPRQLDETGARLLREKVEALGVRVHTGARTTRIEGAGRERSVCLDDGGRIDVDLVVLAAGIRPRGELGRAAGLLTASGGGVVVDDHLASSDPRIFAVGECATHRGVTYGLCAPGYRMVDVLVDNLVGGSAVFEGADRSARLKLLGVSVAALGRHEEAPDTQAHTYLAGGVYRKLVLHDGRIVGALAVGDWADLPRVHDAIDDPRGVSFWDLRRFRSTGSLWLRSESPPVYEWPADALVCGCLGVRRGALTEAEMAGCETAAELSAHTGAGTACGSCRPLLVELVQRARVDSMPPSRLHAWTQARRAVAPDSDPIASPPTLRCSALPAAPALPALPALPPLPPASVSPASVSPASALPPPPPPEPADEPWSRPVRSPVFILPGERARALDMATLPSVDVLSLAGGNDSRLRVRRDAPPPSSTGPARALRSADLLALEPPPSSHLADPVVPSSRRETMAPLRPISVPPSRISGRLAPGAAPTAPPPAPLANALLATAAASLAAVAALLLAPALPPSRSFRGVHLAALWTDRALQQASGYAVVVLSALGLLLSLRKRWRRFSHGSVAGLRVLHGALGAAALVCLGCHTGLHAGERLNRVLALDFLAASALGGVAAAATALGDPAPGAPRRILVTRAHLLVLLPLPVLLALHVLGAYYF